MQYGNSKFISLTDKITAISIQNMADSIVAYGNYNKSKNMYTKILFFSSDSSPVDCCFF
ncbi:hypothetical protein MtrunA17_Chr3g0087131 [Medicago truncatula]|uniref:Uncharacterized protein n=1 Tax=Medicago truncatula TaxID=3880 RepID=A0A396INH0_MEDTR|nr:hypothetical protein MtrunA17_Chr3g0087131 [Medicago truncatula]